VQVNCKSRREPNAGFINAAASEPLKVKNVPGLDFRQLQTRFKPPATLAFSIHDKATLGSRLCCIANIYTEH